LMKASGMRRNVVRVGATSAEVMQVVNSGDFAFVGGSSRS
jgi:hypothetical protein